VDANVVSSVETPVESDVVWLTRDPIRASIHWPAVSDPQQGKSGLPVFMLQLAYTT
jgi:hypothetical protein